MVILTSIVGGGILGYQYWRTQKEEIKMPEKVEDETANWEIYRNETYGFEMKYPENWLTREYSPGRQSHLPKKERTLIVSFASNREDLIKEKGINIFVNPYGPGGWKILCKNNEMRIENIQNLIQKGLIKNYCFTKDELYLATIWDTSFRLYSTEKTKVIFNRMLSSFRFSETGFIMCEKAKTGERDLCFSQLAENQQDESICKKISEVGLKNSCYEEIAEKKKDEVICEKIITQSDRESCYYGVATAKEDEILCGKTGSNKEYCYFRMAVLKEDSNLCKKAGSHKEICYEFIEIAMQAMPEEVDTTNWKIYKNKTHGFGFKYPEDFLLEEGPIGGWDYINIKEPEKDLFIRISMERDTRGSGYNTSKMNFEEFAVYQAIKSCAADGPDASIYCAEPTLRKLFKNKNGIEEYEIYVTQITRSFKEELTRKINIKGPIFAFDISQQTDFAQGVSFVGEKGEEISKILRGIANTLEFHY